MQLGHLSWLSGSDSLAESPVDANGHPKLGKADAKAIVKILILRIAPKEKLSSCVSMKKCNKWLGKDARGTTWVDEMKQVEKEANDSPAPSVRLF